MAPYQPQDVVAPDYARYTPKTHATEKEPFLNEAQELPLASPSPRRPHSLSRMMPSIRALIVGLTCLLITLSLTLALTPGPRSGCHDSDSKAEAISDASSSSDVSTLRNLLDAVSPESLHELLHQYFPGRYQHGVWPSDRAAVEAVAVHEDGSTVTSLVRMLRRQDNSTSSTTTSTSEQPSPTTTTTPLPTSTTVGTTSNVPTSSSSTQGSSAGSSSSTGGTSAGSSTSRPASTTTSKRLQTNTLTSFVNGSPTVVYETTYVDADPGSQSTIAASLQTNAAVAQGRQSHGMVDAAVAGAVIVGGVLLI